MMAAHVQPVALRLHRPDVGLGAVDVPGVLGVRKKNTTSLYEISIYNGAGSNNRGGRAWGDSSP